MVKSWLIELELLFLGRPNDYQTDQARIATALSFMGGDRVVNFKEITIQQANQIDPATGQAQGLGTWDRFSADIYAMFANPIRADEARDKLWGIRWNQNKESALDFRQRFLSLTHEGKVTDFGTLLQIFQEALPPKIRMDIRLQHPPPGDSLEEWMARVYARDQEWRREQAKLEAALAKKNRFGRNRTAKATETEEAVEANKLTTEEYKELRQKGACFLCKKQGHISKMCPERKGSRNRFQSKKWNPNRKDKKARKVEHDSDSDQGNEIPESDSDDDVQQAAATTTDFKRKDF